jgi:hypothetical protein
VDDLTEPEQPMPNCLDCAHYYITHDASFPYGCRGMNFKSKRLPQLEVIQASKAYCLVFQQKQLY